VGQRYDAALSIQLVEEVQIAAPLCLIERGVNPRHRRLAAGEDDVVLSQADAERMRCGDESAGIAGDGAQHFAGIVRLAPIGGIGAGRITMPSRSRGSAGST